MAKRILIITQTGDVHAYAVAEALKQKGAEPILWHSTDFASRAHETLLFENQRKTVRIQGPEIDLAHLEADTVWHRRPSYSIDEELLHPADRKYADLQCKVFRRSLLNLLAPCAFWVNPREAALRASRKMVQHDAAVQVGLEMPDTLYSNDPQEIRAFIRRQGGRIAFKPLKPLQWRSEDTFWIPYTSVLTEDALTSEELLRTSPGIYQALVPKSCELRIAVMGRLVSGAKLFSQETEGGKLDWRRSHDELRMEPYPVPPELAGRCIALLERLGIVFGCFDFVVTPQGRHIFLEVNEMGQFLFVERETGQPLLDAFSEFLLRGRADFSWDEKAVEVRYSDVLPTVEAMAAKAYEVHAPAPESFAQERPQSG